MPIARPLTIALVGAALALTPLSAQVPDSSAGVKAVLAAETAYWKAEMSGDTVVMARLMAPNYVVVYPGQEALDRPGLLAMIRPDTAGETEEVGNWHFMDYGSTLVAVGDYVTVMEGQTQRSQVFDTWMKQGTGWQLVFSVIATVPGAGAGQ
jgi:uncharacterized protein DUF4440